MRADTRYTTRVKGRYRIGNGVYRDVTVMDLSEAGARFFDKFGSLKRGQVITLKLGPIGPIAANIAWSRGQLVGVKFDYPLYGPVFEHLRDQVNDTSGQTAMAGRV